MAKRVKRGVKKVNPKRGGHRFPDGVNEPLRTFVRELPCAIHGLNHPSAGLAHLCWGEVVCAHIKTRGSGAPDDDNVVPLCLKAHVLQEGNTARFEASYGIRLKPIARRITARFYREYPRQQSGRDQAGTA